MIGLPVWAVILVCLPVVLWSAYCLLALVQSVECGGHCFVNFALIGLGTVGYGLYAGVGAFVGVGALILFFILLSFCGVLLVEHLNRKRRAEEETGEASNE